MELRKVYILSGVPGSGKTTWIKESAGIIDYTIVSADNYFTDPITKKYNFNASKLAEAHDECLRCFLRAIESKATRPIIVDNTNLKVWEIAPYYRIAEALGKDPVIIRFVGDPRIAAGRNVHGVPFEKVLQMHNGIEPLPPWWNVEYVYIEL